MLSTPLTAGLPAASSRLFLGAARLRFLGSGALRNHFVDNTKGFRLLRCHEVVAIERALNDLVRLTGMLDVDLVQAALCFKDVLGVPFDIARLRLETGRGLMHHDPRIRKRPAHPMLARSEQERSHG